ncbi:MAG: HlyD family efflux transporter periplasmic adaptor subunit [Proteobacteria bacterium]|nr:HlyD family efflux transporter periplasmic adaptor subunit [Pseudomonadota bacterium]
MAGKEQRTDGQPDGASGAAADRHLPRLVVDRRAQPEQPASRYRLWLYRARYLPLIWLLLVSGAFIGLYFQPPLIRIAIEKLGFKPGGGSSNPVVVLAPPPKAAAPALPPVVVGLGKLLPEGDVRTISVPYGAGDARIAELKVQDGDTVIAGQVLGVLDNERALQAGLISARSTLAAKEAAFEQVRATIRASRDEAVAALGRAENALQNAQRELERTEQLRRGGYAAEAAHDLKRTAVGDATREMERLKATLSRYGGALDAQPDVVLAARTRDSAAADVGRAESDLEKAYVRAPIAGTVLSIEARPGEKPGVQGIMKLGDLAHMKAEVEVYQAQIGRVAVGNTVTLAAEALPRPLTGTVSRIGLEVGRQTITDSSPAANTDARVVKVTVVLDPEMSRIAARFTNLQVTARITVDARP